MTTTPRLVIATDGSALGNPGPAGWAWAAASLNMSTPQVWAAGSIGHGTNNEAELMALLEVLRSVPAHLPLELRMDSQYALNAAEKWRHGWKRRQWKTAAGQPVKNLDIIVAIDAALEGRDIKYVWVKAHQGAGRGDPLNEFVDAAAKAAAAAGRAGRAIPAGPGWPQQ
jgi:ribonuclease HI